MLRGATGGPGGGEGSRRRVGGVRTSLGAADLSQLGGPLALVAPEEGVGVLQAAAEGQLPRLGLGAVATHLVLAVGQHLRHGGAERAEPRRAEPGASLRRRRRQRGGKPGGRMKSCIRGERGPPHPGGAGGGGSELRGRDGTRGGTGGGCPSPCPGFRPVSVRPSPAQHRVRGSPPSPLSPWPKQRSPVSVPSVALHPHR